MVVMSVVALLIALLLPALENAVENARQSICAANLHQTLIAIHSYVTDESDLLPSYTVPPGTTDPAVLSFLNTHQQQCYTLWQIGPVAKCDLEASTRDPDLHRQITPDDSSKIRLTIRIR